MPPYNDRTGLTTQRAMLVLCSQRPNTNSDLALVPYVKNEDKPHTSDATTTILPVRSINEFPSPIV